MPKLELASADEAWAPNKRVARALGELGFDEVAVRRLRVEKPRVESTRAEPVG